jgi:hypothetical protein
LLNSFLASLDFFPIVLLDDQFHIFYLLSQLSNLLLIVLNLFDIGKLLISIFLDNGLPIEVIHGVVVL